MTYDLYWVSVLGYIVITLIILIRERKYTHHNEKAGRVFLPLVCLSLAFYVVDFFWGMCLVDAIRSDAVYFVLSALLHVLAVVTTLSWLCYVLRYMNCPRRCRYVIQFVSAAQLLSEVVLVIANFFSPVMYRIVDGEYVRCKYALVTAFNIYSVFAVVLLGTLFAMMRKGICANGYTRYWAVLFSSLIPLLLGIMQVKYFASPFFSMGFMLSTLILYVFVVTAAREKLYQSKTKFLQNMSHEIRTSLNMVYGFAQLLGMPEGSWTDEEREKYNTYINDNYRMLDLLLNDLGYAGVRYDMTVAVEASAVAERAARRLHHKKRRPTHTADTDAYALLRCAVRVERRTAAECQAQRRCTRTCSSSPQQQPVGNERAARVR